MKTAIKTETPAISDQFDSFSSLLFFLLFFVLFVLERKGKKNK
jgi:hypothetical protein